MDFKGLKVGDSVIYVPSINGNRDLAAGERIEVEMLPLSNDELNALIRQASNINWKRTEEAGFRRGKAEPEFSYDLSGVTRRIIAERVSVIRNLTLDGQAVTDGRQLVEMLGSYQSNDLNILVEELADAAADISILNEGLIKN